jgi:predicted aspartyl protease
MKTAIFLLLLALPASMAMAQEAGPSVNSIVTTVKTGDDKTQRMTVPVLVNGSGPYQFVIDTGSDSTVISSELAEALKMETAGKARIQAMNGAAQARMVKVKSLQLSNNTQTDFKAPAIPRERLGADGLLGTNSLEKQRVTLDFDSGEMLVEPSTAPMRPKPPNSEEIIIQTRSRLGQMVMIDADAGQEKVWAIVDTGGETTIANPALRRVLVRNQRVKALNPITITDVMGRSTQADYTLIERIRIGGLLIGQSNVAFMNANPFRLFKLQKRPSMMIGMATLRAFRRVTIDFVRRRVIFLLPR